MSLVTALSKKTLRGALDFIIVCLIIQIATNNQIDIFVDGWAAIFSSPMFLLLIFCSAFTVLLKIGHFVSSLKNTNQIEESLLVES